jgi:F-type H+-transporting ATPase subunit a
VLSLRVAGRPLLQGEAALAFAWSLVAMLVLVVLAAVGTRRLSIRPGGLQAFLEMVVEGLKGLVEGVMGPRGVAFVPFIGALFIYIALMNLMGLVPGFMAPTSNLSITAALAIVVFVVVQYHGFRAHGFGYLKHFVEGVPLRTVYLPLAALVFVIHVIGEIFRPVTLALRLRGNIMAGETVVGILLALGALILARAKLPLPLQLPNLLLELLIALVQATIFCMLTAVYLSGVLHDEAPRQNQASPPAGGSQG